MKLLIKLAWRNVWRNKRRSILTLAAVTFAVFMAIGMRGIQLGTYALNIKSAVELFSGYLQVQAKGYIDTPKLSLCFKEDDNLSEVLNNTKGIDGYSKRVYADGLISFKENSRGVAIFGIEPQKEKKVTTFVENIDEGKFFSTDSSKEIVVGTQLLKNLGVKIGDEIVILAQGYDGSLGNQKYKIAGTVRLGVQEFNSTVVFMGLKTAQSLLAMGNNINVIAIKAKNINNLVEIENKLSTKITDNNLTVLPWNKVNPELQQAIQLDNVSGILFLGILIVIVAFGILNTVLMSVTERFREFGVILSIGMPQRKLTYVVYLETIFLAIIGLVFGNILGYFINYYLILHPIVFGGEIKKLYELYHFLPELRSSLQVSIFTNVSLSIIGISILSCLYPAYKVYKLEPLKGIRQT
ncbi:MAG TPA: FtsX-like permease family protein [Ignavibacteriaceae bacterium]|nr:FtsX-like permease family protein [Ignavibacteriaceae bacterium]